MKEESEKTSCTSDRLDHLKLELGIINSLVLCDTNKLKARNPQICFYSTMFELQLQLKLHKFFPNR